MNATYKTLDDLQAQCDAMRGYEPAYYVKQMHAIPDAPVVDRMAYVLAQCQGKRVLHLGCGWPPSALHQALERVALIVYGIDCEVPLEHADAPTFGRIDLDDGAQVDNLLCFLKPVDIIVCAEILEHLGNPGQLVAMLKDVGKPVLITCPNAFSRAGMSYVLDGIENVNRQHTCYFSYWTLHALVTRHGYTIDDWAWYNGSPRTAEGLIFLVR